MGKRNRNRNTEYSNPADDFFEDDEPHIITEADGTRRALSGEELAAEFRTNASLLAEMHHDDDEPMDTGYGAPRPTNLVGLGASQTADGADKASPPVSPTNLVGTQSDAPGSKPTPPTAAAQKKSRSASTEGKRKKKPTSSKTTAKTAPSVKSRSSEEFTAEDLAAAKQQYTLAQAKAWLNIETTARTEDDFRRELTHFWDNGRDLNRKPDGAQFKAFSTPWKAHS